MSNDDMKIGQPLRDIYTTLQKNRYDFERYLLDLIPDYQTPEARLGGAHVSDEVELHEHLKFDRALSFYKKAFDVFGEKHSAAEVGVINPVNKVGFVTCASASGLVQTDSGAVLAPKDVGAEKLSKVKTKVHEKVKVPNKGPDITESPSRIYMKVYKDGYVIYMGDNNLTDPDIIRLKKVSLDLINSLNVKVYKVFVNDVLIFDGEREDFQILSEVSVDSEMDLKV